MKLELLADEFSICRIDDLSVVDYTEEFVFINKTRTGIDLVCRTIAVPESCLSHEDHWRMFCLAGKLTYTLMGILGKIATILGNNNVGVFVVSTHDNIYYLVREAQLENAVQALDERGYMFV